jgi:uncharacterized protein YjiS (DUF1127 family)
MSILQPRISAAALAQRPRAHAWRHAFERIGELLLAWQERARQRHRLALLSDHMLRDIGLSRADIMAETTKRFWQP